MCRYEGLVRGLLLDGYLSSQKLREILTLLCCIILSSSSALPKFQQCPPNVAQEGVAVGDVAAAEWSVGVAHEAVDGDPP